MDLGIRDWMVIVGGLLILAVLLDGYRRMRSDPNRVRMSLSKVADDDAPVEETANLRELPNGGARVVHRDEPGFHSDLDIGADPDATQADTESEPDALIQPVRREPNTGETLDLLDELTAVDSQAGEEGGLADAQEVIMLHVSARDESGFAGDDILEILLACDMRFGDFDFFHRHSRAAGKGTIEFSVANMVQPGIFDIDAMSDFSTPGLTFFLALPGPENMMAAFDQMLETAQCVADNLSGDLLDDTRSVATKQTLDHIRQRIRDLERLLLTQGGQ